MPASMFDDELPARGDRRPAGFRAGPCAMGPVADGDTITWMRVWVLQKDPSKMAEASGTSGDRVGSQEERPPYRGRWMIRTELEPGSDAFSEDDAIALAVAMVTHADGTRSTEHWSQAVSIVTREREHQHH